MLRRCVRAAHAPLRSAPHTESTGSRKSRQNQTDYGKWHSVKKIIFSTTETNVQIKRMCPDQRQMPSTENQTARGGEAPSAQRIGKAYTWRQQNRRGLLEGNHETKKMRQKSFQVKHNYSREINTRKQLKQLSTLVLLGRYISQGKQFQSAWRHRHEPKRKVWQTCKSSLPRGKTSPFFHTKKGRRKINNSTGLLL